MHMVNPVSAGGNTIWRVSGNFQVDPSQTRSLGWVYRSVLFLFPVSLSLLSIHLEVIKVSCQALPALIFYPCIWGKETS